jgi:hypothetical protein
MLAVARVNILEIARQIIALISIIGLSIYLCIGIIRIILDLINAVRG